MQNQGIEASWCRKPTLAAGVFFSAILPLLAGFLFHVPRVALGNFTDAVFYLSYARQFGELVLRYGFPYYATRFGGILPDVISGQLFGEINGIWILRWILSAAVSASLFLIFKKRYGLLAGILASVLWSFNAAALRLLCTTYVDSTAVPFLIMGCCLFVSVNCGTAGAVLSGIFFALAASAHLYAAFALVLLLPLLIGSRLGDRRGLTHSFCWAGLGFLLSFTLAWIWYWVVWRMPSLFGPTLDLMHDLGHGQAAQWKKPIVLALRETPAWFAPLTLIPALWLVATRGSAFVRGALLSLFLSAGFFWCGDLFGSAYVLSMPFYYSFLLPVMTLAGAVLCGEILTRELTGSTRSVVFSALALASIAPMILAYRGAGAAALEAAVIAAPLLLILASWKSLRGPRGALLGVLCITASSLLLAATGIFSQMIGHYADNDIPLLEMASSLRKALPSATQDTKVTRFWYDDDLQKGGAADRRMIGSFWLHTFGKLTGQGDEFVPFPSMGPDHATAVSRSGVDRIILYDQDPGRVAAALEEVSKRKLPFRISKSVTIHATTDPSRTLEVKILEREEVPPSGNVISVDLHGIELGNHGKSNWIDGALMLTLTSNKWWNLAKLPLPGMKEGDRLRVRSRIDSGFVRFTLGDEKSNLGGHVEKWPSDSIQEIVLTAPKDLGNPYLGLRSLYPDRSASRVILEKVQIEKVTP